MGDDNTQHKISRDVEEKVHLKKREKQHQDRGRKAAGLQAIPTGTELQQAGYSRKKFLFGIAHMQTKTKSIGRSSYTLGKTSC